MKTYPKLLFLALCLLAGSGIRDAFAADRAGGDITDNAAKPRFVTSDPNGGWSQGGYYIHNNMWNHAKYPCTSTLTAWSHDNWQVVTSINNKTRDGAVKTYPNVHKDYRAAPLDSFDTITSTFAATSPGIGIYNVAYDIWINGIGKAKPDSVELMIWTDNHGQTPAGKYQEDATFGDRIFKVYRTKTGRYIALVPRKNFASGKLDLLEIIKWIEAKGWLRANSTLTQICFGIEMVSTEDTDAKFQVTAFSIDAKARQ